MLAIIYKLLMMAEDGQQEVKNVSICSENEARGGARRKSVVTKIQEEPRSVIPPINIPEKLILCLDVSSTCSSFYMYPEKPLEPELLLKQCSILLISNKLDCNPKTEIAVILLNGSSCCWYAPLSSNRDMLCNQIKRIRVNKSAGSNMKTESTSNSYCMDPIFNMIFEEVPLPQVTSNTNILPPFVVRCIFFYSRSQVLTIDKSREAFQKLVSSPYFNFDSFYLHDNDTDDELRIAIIEQMLQLNKGFSYILESDTNLLNFMNTFSLLSAHSLQRPKQSELCTDWLDLRKQLKSNQ